MDLLLSRLTLQGGYEGEDYDEAVRRTLCLRGEARRR
jgi:hypothetical protein